MTTQLPEKESILLPPLPLAQTPSSRLSNPDDEDSHSLTPTSAPSKTRSPISPSPSSTPLHQLLLLNQSPIRRPRSRRLQMDVENLDPEYQPPRRRNRNNQQLSPNIEAPSLGFSSPRNIRRSRRRLEKKEDKEEVKIRRTAMKKHGSKTNRKERLVAVMVEEAPPPSPSLSSQQGTTCTGTVSLGTWKLVSDLVMWKDVSKSSFWFGFGSLFFLQSFFSKDLKFSMISAISHLCLFILAMSFFRHSINQQPRSEEQRRQRFVMKEENLLQITTTLLPILNASIAMTQEVFSGDPSMTLKVAPLLAFTAHYGHFITPWRLSATGFFISFTVPKLYSCYSQQMQALVFSRISYVWEAWKACQHKKLIAFSAAILFWNVFGAKTRILALFIAIVSVQYHRKKKMIMMMMMMEKEKDESEHI